MLADSFERAREAERSRRRGVMNEARALRVLLTGEPRPWWLEGARACNDDEDHLGIDLVVQHAGRRVLWLQIKSSEAGAAKFARKRPEGARIACVVVTPRDSDRELYGRLLGALIVLREEMGL